ncbi:hypothetical protein [Hymenobacter chitinivorans]|uniref:Uncharacterized protein n=1 Tax=Hymenobacter chitinivorans DSM 11115 TaxID=1121954 RepID=A0A2M9BSL3_9BACT|nr:hypothetical protein [Hymenobacter chitinivorans]PJJ60935.1 hypothetical protein CLV45_2372 [Hymenobacter chitinivorans DSM 11115]
MAYPINLLTSAPECDALLEAAQQELRDLRVRETVLAAQGERTSESATDTTADLAAQAAIIAALAPIVPNLPAGSKARINTEADLRHATQRHQNLTANQQLRGPVAALTRALDLRQVQVQIAEINTFVAEVTARKAAL